MAGSAVWAGVCRGVGRGGGRGVGRGEGRGVEAGVAVGAGVGRSGLAVDDGADDGDASAGVAHALGSGLSDKPDLDYRPEELERQREERHAIPASRTMKCCAPEVLF